MRKPYPFIQLLVFALLANVYGQKPVIELTFTAIYYGQYVPLDSIYIENLTQGGDTMIFAPDTVLMLDYIIGVHDNPCQDREGDFFLTQNYPNPFTGETVIYVYLPEQDQIKLRVHDHLGREVACCINTLCRGVHSYTFFPGTVNYYIFSATGRQGTKAIKMVSLRGGKYPSFKLVYNGMTGNPAQIKSSSAVNDLGFSPGDRLRFIGYATTPWSINGSDVIEDIPISDSTYLLAIREGLPCPGTPSIFYKGQVYRTVQIGSQCWMKDNLNVGIMISAPNSQSNNGIIEKYCYGNDAQNCDLFGGLYGWDEMMQYIGMPGLKGICPDNWHVPSDNELCLLIKFIDATVYCGALGWTGTNAGLKMKSTAGWYSGGNGTNASGFSALPGGHLQPPATFEYITNSGCFWSATLDDYNQAYYWAVKYNQSGIGRFVLSNDYGRNVRCIKN